MPTTEYTRLLMHPFADGFRKLSSSNFALVDVDGNTVDIVTASEMDEIVAEDDDLVDEQSRSDAAADNARPAYAHYAFADFNARP